MSSVDRLKRQLARLARAYQNEYLDVPVWRDVYIVRAIRTTASRLRALRGMKQGASR